MALTKAVAWLDRAKHSDSHQDKVFRVILGIRSDRPREDCKRRSANCWPCNAPTAAGASQCRS